jgi:hypothetical protein
MLTRRPDLFAAVCCAVPLLDMKCYHTLLAGASWVAEYGNPDLPQVRVCICIYVYLFLSIYIYICVYICLSMYMSVYLYLLCVMYYVFNPLSVYYIYLIHT